MYSLFRCISASYEAITEFNDLLLNLQTPTETEYLPYTFELAPFYFHENRFSSLSGISYRFHYDLLFYVSGRYMLPTAN